MSYPDRPEASWVNYMTLLEDAPAMLTVDSSWIEALGYGNAETMLCVEVMMKQQGETEIVSRDELPALQELAESLEGELQPDYAHLVARSYGDGKMVLYLYTTDPDAVMKDLEPVVDETDYEVTKSEFQDPDWEFYEGTLFPDDIVWQNITNEQILAQLEEHEDRGDQPRLITHAADFPDRDLAGEYARQLGELGHEIAEFTDSGSEDFPFRVMSEREDEPRGINDITTPLILIARDCGGAYAGWTTSVVVSEAEEDEDDEEEA